MDFVFRVRTEDPHDVAQVHFIHADDVVEFIVVFFSHLAGVFL